MKQGEGLFVKMPVLANEAGLLRYQAIPERCRHVVHECEVRLRPALNRGAYGVEDTDTRRGTQ